jgi:hypothetical protein
MQVKIIHPFSAHMNKALLRYPSFHAEEWPWLLPLSGERRFKLALEESGG